MQLLLLLSPILKIYFFHRFRNVDAIDSHDFFSEMC